MATAAPWNLENDGIVADVEAGVVVEPLPVFGASVVNDTREGSVKTVVLLDEIVV